MEVTNPLAGFAANLKYADLPAAVVAKTKQLITDCLGNQIGAVYEESGKILHQTLGVDQVPGCSTVVGFGTRTSALLAACMNAMLAHSLDMDDAHRDALTKTGSAITPAVLAVAEAIGSSGEEVITASVAGYEVMIRLGLAVNPGHRKRGFHSSASLGCFGSAAAAGRLLGLTSSEMAGAFGVAATQASGLVAFINNPSMIKPFNVAKGVYNGVLAALLVKNGFIGPENIFESQEGFINAYTDEANINRLTDRLGSHFHIMESGFKPHAACRYAHGPIDASVELIKKYRFEPEYIEGLDVYLSELAGRQSHFYEPRSVASAQGSTPFSIAVGIVTRSQFLTVQDFKDAFAMDKTWRLHRKVHVHVDPGMDYMGRGCRLVLSLTDGTQYQVEVNLPKGEPENPMSPQDIAKKFFRQVEPVLGAGTAQEIHRTLANLEAISGPGLSDSLSKTKVVGR